MEPREGLEPTTAVYETEAQPLNPLILLAFQWVMGSLSWVVLPETGWFWAVAGTNFRHDGRFQIGYRFLQSVA